MQLLVWVLREETILFKQIAQHAVEDFTLPLYVGVLKPLQHFQYLQDSKVMSENIKSKMRRRQRVNCTKHTPKLKT